MPDIFDKVLQKAEKYPVLIRGTCVEEAIWLLGANRDKYKIRPEEICAFPIKEGFEKAKIKPIKPIPDNYTLEKLRDEILLFADAFFKPPFYYGNQDTQYHEDLERCGVIVYFNPEILTLGYEQDTDVDDRLEQLCSVRLEINENFDPEHVLCVEPLGLTEYKLLIEHAPDDKKYSKPRFINLTEMMEYIISVTGITITSRGYTFPK